MPSFSLIVVENSATLAAEAAAVRATPAGFSLVLAMVAEAVLAMAAVAAALLRVIKPKSGALLFF